MKERKNIYKRRRVMWTTLIPYTKSRKLTNYSQNYLLRKHLPAFTLCIQLQ